MTRAATLASRLPSTRGLRPIAGPSSYNIAHSLPSIRKQLLVRLSRHNSTSSSPSTSPPTPESLPTGDKGKTKEAPSKDATSLSYLPRPLGVSEPPTVFRKTWSERTQELLDQDVRLQRREQIVKEATKGYYSDFHALKEFGGKTWIAPPTLIREDQALYFPDVSGISLHNREFAHTAQLCAGKISVVGVLSTRISEEHVDSFVMSTNSAYLSNPHYQFVQINLQENMLKAFLVSFYITSLQRSVPQELQPTYILSKQSMDYVREPLSMNNKHIGFVYLLDQNMKVRWAGGGIARPEEAESLQKCVGVLLKRGESKQE